MVELPRHRLAKMMAHAGLCSRRTAETWITAGRVNVNGKTILTPAFTVTTADQIVVDNQSVDLALSSRLWAYHKPVGLLTTHADPEGRPTVFDHLPADLPRVISVGRLDFNSEGLLLLTNNGALSRTLEHPSSGLKRLYRVRVRGTIPDDFITELDQGLVIAGMVYQPIRVTIDKISRENAWLMLTLTEGKNREIRNIMHYFGLQVSRLIRIQYGPFQLETLAPGQCREIPQNQFIEFLKS